MTIEEAIERYIDDADYERAHGNLQGCLEFKQLVKWLKELCVYREMYREYNCLREESEEQKNEE